MFNIEPSHPSGFFAAAAQDPASAILMKILLTGSSGLVGRNLSRIFVPRGAQVRHFDVARSPLENVRDPVSCKTAIAGVDGILHLAAISRVITAEKDQAQRDTRISNLLVAG
jgi:nucleoside-diphosphate-sugar epimerase